MNTRSGPRAGSRGALRPDDFEGAPQKQPTLSRAVDVAALRPEPQPLVEPGATGGGPRRDAGVDAAVAVAIAAADLGVPGASERRDAGALQPAAPVSQRGCSLSGTLAFDSPGDVTVDRVVVYVSQGQAAARAAMSAEYVIAQQNQQFVPDVLVIQRNDSVRFPNRDRIEHSVFSTEGTVNIPPSTRAEPEPVAFAKVGSFRIQCNIHSNMRADVLVVPARALHTFVGRDGSWRIDGVTASQVTVTAWEPNGGTVTQVVSPCDGRPVALSLRGHRAPTLRKRDGSLYKDYAGP
ncbi:MAG: hypothetical protein SFW67_00845 [Myxococcaceae bacterium]|nr:hypothetical protein [Myxococcaceae bacterium]